MAGKVIHRYIFKEILLPFSISLLVFTGILFLFRVLKLIEMLLSKNVDLGEVLLLFSYVIPRFLEVALPMSTLLGIIVAFGRLSSDSEIVVVRASGMSLKQLLIPVTSFAALVMLATGILTFYISPYANHELGVGIFRLAKVQARSGLIPGVFNSFGPLTVYAENISDQGKRLESILISDRLDEDSPKTSIAKTGQLIGDDLSRQLTLRLYDGSIYEGQGSNFNLTRFDIENVNLSGALLNEEEPTRDGKVSNELSMTQLGASLDLLRQKQGSLSSEERKQLSRYEVEWHRRIVLPVACLCVALVAMCLGIQPSRGGFSWGMSATVTIGVTTIILYYLCLALASALGKQAIAPAWIVMWVPNILFLALAVWLIKQIGSEKWLTVGQAFGSTVERLATKIKFRDRTTEPST